MVLLATRYFTMRTEQLTKCCEPLQKQLQAEGEVRPV